MMDWKDTVVSDDDISERWHMKEHSDDNDGSWHYRLGALRWIVKAQAEISFKAGIREVVEWINKKRLQEGSFSKVVLFQGDAEILNKEWQAKLKEWGI